MKQSIAAIAFILSALLGTGLSSAGNADRPVVVELFTSQGCSSCPPADAYLGDLAARDDVIALTFAVDYWDYLGWKDTFANPEFSLRQRDYAQRRGDRQVYTPQMVIDGRVHAVGSRRAQVEAAIQQVRESAADEWIDVGIHARGDALVVHAPGTAGSDDRMATLWLAFFTRKESVSIRRGENGGRKIEYHNVVRKLMPIGKWSGKPVEISLPKTDIVSQGYDGCAVFLQMNGTGPIIGSAAIDDWMVN